MDDLPSGLHRYAGNSAHTKFRVVLTDPIMLSEKWYSSRTSSSDDKYQIKKNTSIRQDGSNLNVQYQASYLLTKASSTNRWVVDDEEARRNVSRGDSDSTGGVESAMFKAGTRNGTPSFATILRREGFVLSVVSVPSESRTKCHVCQRGIFRNCATIINDFDREWENHLFNEGKQKSEPTVKGSTAADRLVPASTHFEGEEKANYMWNLRHNDVSKDFWNLFSKPKRASPWKDTLNMTSASLSNGYWRSVDARKLATWLRDSTDEYNSRATETTASSAIIPLMRNHYFPPFEPRQCSRIKLARADKTLDEFCVRPSVCPLCLNDNGSASDNNENRNSHDRREDNLQIPINEILRCRCRTTNCLSPKPIVRHCRCAELKDGYKSCQKLLNRLVEGNETKTKADPFSDNLSFFKFNSHKSDNIEAKALNRELAKLTELNEIDNSLNHGSCDVLLDPLLSHPDQSKEMKELDGSDEEADFLFKVNEALGKSQADTLEGRNLSGDATANLSVRRRLKSTNSDEYKSANNLKETLDHVCYCTESHGETLIVLLEKHKPGYLRFQPNEQSHEERHEPTLPANNENGAKIDKSHETKSLEQSDEQSRDHRELTSSRQNLIVTGAEQSMGISDIATSSDDSRANANKRAQSEQIDEFNQRHRMESNNQALSSAQIIPGGLKDDVNIRMRPELHLSARELHSLADKHDYQIAQHDVQRDYSVVLAVIVIDAFNGTIHVKPDLNKLILLDLSTLNVRTNEIPDATAIDSLRIGANDLNQQWLNRKAQIFYHIEVHESAADMEASERDLKFFRDLFELKQHIHDLPRLGGESFKKHWSGKHISICDEPSSTLHKDGSFIKLQFDIHYGHRFPTDCKNIYIRYKIYSVEHEGWQIRRHSEAPAERGGVKKLRDESLIRGDSSTAFSHAGEDETKLEHMTHIRRNIFAPNDSGLGDTNFVANDIAPVASYEWLVLDGGKHDINQASVMESCCRDFESDSDKQDDGDDEDGSDQYQLLLEGSTITSRPDSRGHFNFCCVEQLLLKSSRKTTRSPGDNGKKVSSSRIKQDDAIMPPNETKGQEKISAKIDEQKRTKPNDINQMQTRTKVIHSTPTDRMITESLEHSLKADGEQISSPMITSENFIISTEMDHETDNIFPSDKITIEQSPANNDTKNSSKSKPLKDQSSSERLSKSSRIASHGLQDDILRNNLGGACQIIFVFEVYSSDFYSDKLKGWSSMVVPISLDRGGHNMLDGICEPVLSSHDKSTRQRSHRSFKFRRSRESHHLELPVIRPALSAPIDRLRYYLLGEIPMKAPTISSVSIFLGIE